jgi:hypothetical protein
VDGGEVVGRVLYIGLFWPREVKDISVGTYDNLQVAYMDALVINVIHQMVDHDISSVPILGDEGGRHARSMTGTG